MTRTKFIPGDPVTTVQAVADAASAGEPWFYIGLRGRPLHPRVVASWQLSTVADFIRRGSLLFAARNPDYREPKGGPRPWGGGKGRRHSVFDPFRLAVPGSGPTGRVRP